VLRMAGRAVRTAVGACLGVTVALALVVAPGSVAGATAARTPKPKAPAGPTVKITRPSKYSLDNGFVGLTFEATTLGSQYLDPTQSNLPSFLAQLGPGDLRFGGQSSDLDAAWLPSASDPLPSWATSGITPADLATVGDLARTSGWKVDLGVNLLEYDPTLAANEVQAAQAAIGSSLRAVEIGNEPDLYFYFLTFLAEPPGNVATTFPGYLTNWNAYRSAIEQADPGVAVDGPDFYLTNWLADETKKTEQGLTRFDQHFYPLEDCGGADLTPDQLLAPSSFSTEDTLINSAQQAAKHAKLPLVLDEFNSISCGSSSPAAWEFASSLWAVHALLDAASDGVASVNVQMDPGNCDSYTPLCVPDPSEPGTVQADPIFYGMQLVSGLEGGTLLKTTVVTDPLPSGASEYALRLPDGNVAVVVDNTTPTALTPLSLELDSTAHVVSVEQLQAPSLTSTTGVTLTTSTPANSSPLGLSVPAETAEVVTLAS
jgi:hypothetical protein